LNQATLSPFGGVQIEKREKRASAGLKEAFGYLRVSGKGQLTGDGFPRQRATIEAYANARGYKIVKWFEERAIPGATEWENRPAWVEMMQQLNGVRTVLVEKVERLARDLGVQKWIFRDLRKRRVELISATEENLDADPARVLFRQILGAIAQYDKAMTVLKLRHARKQIKAATGRCEGQKPYGHFPGESAIVARMCELRNRGCSYTAIAESLNRECVSTRVPGRRWDPRTVQRIMKKRTVSFNVRTVEVPAPPPIQIELRMVEA
jgi:DNA invertase Pin-like site-specific DNA recombinase